MIRKASRKKFSSKRVKSIRSGTLRRKRGGSRTLRRKRGGASAFAIVEPLEHGLVTMLSTLYNGISFNKEPKSKYFDKLTAKFTNLKDSNGNKLTPTILKAGAESQTENRHGDILPNIETIVNITDATNDPKGGQYINANYILDKKYIAAMGPKQHTYKTFWKMICQQNIKIIVMLTGLVELGKNKCYPYWPIPQNDKTILYNMAGDIPIPIEAIMEKKIIDGVCEITWISCERIGSFIKTKLEIYDMQKNSNKFIAHYWYTEWPDHGVPMIGENEYDTNSIYVMLMDIINQQKKESAQTPLVVHCSAGVGRTGTIIGCHHAMTRVLVAGEVAGAPIDLVVEILNAMRQDRCMLIQVIAQFKLFYKYIVDYYKILSDAKLATQPETKPVPDRFKRRMASVRYTGSRGVSIDPEYIKFEKTNPFYTPPIDYFKEYFNDQYDAFTALEKIRSIKDIKNTDIMKIDLTDIFGLGDDEDSEEVKIRTGFNTVMDSETADNKFIWSLRRQKNREHSVGRETVSIKTGSSFMNLGGKAEKCRIEGVKAYDFYLEYKSSDTVESANNTDPCGKPREFKDYYYEVGEGVCIKKNIVSTNVVIAESVTGLAKSQGFDISTYKLAQYGCFHIGTYKDSRCIAVARVVKTAQPITITPDVQKKMPKDMRKMCENYDCIPSYQSSGKLSQKFSDDIKQALIMISAAHNQDSFNVGSRAHAKSFENIQAFFYSKKKFESDQKAIDAYNAL